LAVVAGSTDNPAGAAVTHDYFSSLLFESGRPVLVVPPQCSMATPPHRIAVAWSPSREATRALHDAMPLLLKADAVDIVAVDPVAGELEHGEQPGADIATHLARHGVKVNVVVLGADDQPVGSVLLDHAYRTRADLLVTGGYGHSRAKEWALGGVTRELLLFAPIPVFYSH
jgi:nucleotide-binding universal stress UspA family protein